MPPGSGGVRGHRRAARGRRGPGPVGRHEAADPVGDRRRTPAPAAGAGSCCGASVRRGLLRKAGPFALVACLAAASFASLAAWQHEQGEQSAQRALQAEERLDAVSSVLAAPDARTSQGKAANGALMTFVSSDRRNMAVVTATGLPSPAPGTTYQLWLDVDGSMRPAGFLHGDGTVPVKGDPAAATAVGLTVEPAGGSSRPTTDPLLLMALPA